mgnify:CR=1 FL=1
MAELATPYVAWWALVPLLVFSAGGLLPPLAWGGH